MHSAKHPSSAPSPADLARVIDRLGRPRLLVLGDLMLDQYTLGRATRISPEAPVPVLDYVSREERPGGAASVALLAAGLGAEVHVAGVTGADLHGQYLAAMLRRARADTSLIVEDDSRETTCKERVTALAPGDAWQTLVRIDREDRRGIPPELAERLAQAVCERLETCQALLISDYGKGTCPPALLREVIHAARRHQLPVLVDPARGLNWGRYAGCTLIKCNKLEAQQVLGDTIVRRLELRNAEDEIRSRTSALEVVITLDRDGAYANGRHYAVRDRRVVDVTAAGDMALAALGLVRASGVSLDEAVRLANTAAGLEVEHRGVSVVSRHEWRADLLRAEHTGAHKLISLERAVELVAEHRQRGECIVFTNGCFDHLLHEGHQSTLAFARRQGDVLFVAVNSDRAVQTLKGSGRPVLGETRRMRALAGLECVDYVLLMDALTPHELLRKLRPDVLVKGGDYRPDQVVGHEVITECGGRVAVAPNVPNISTTKLLNGVHAADEPRGPPEPVNRVAALVGPCTD